MSPRKIPVGFLAPFRYGVQGLFNVAFTYMVFGIGLFLLSEKYYSVALTLAFLVTLPLAFVMQKRWVFAAHRSRTFRASLKYVAVFVGHFIANLFVLNFLVEVLYIQPLRAQFIWTIFSASLRYLLLRKWVFLEKVE